MSDSSSSTLPYVLAIASAAFVLNSFFQSSTYKLRKIPSAGGPSAPILYYYSVFNILRRGPAILEEANRKFKGHVFKYATMEGWMVVVTDPRLIDELGRAPEDVFSIGPANKRNMQTYYTMGRPLSDNPYHNNVVHSLLTRNLEMIYPDIHDEVVAAFSDHIATKGQQWTTLPVMATNTSIVTRITARAFLGLSLCRNPEYNAFMQKLTSRVAKTTAIINLMPGPLQPLVGNILSIVDSNIEQCSKYTGPVVQERLQMREKHGDDWFDKPVDVLQNLLEIAPKEECDVRGMSMRLIGLSYAAILTSSVCFTPAIVYLASKPAEYLYPLREEVDSVVAKYGWTRDALQKMRKLDSFLKETLRVVGLASVMSMRMAKKDYTFSDGTQIPAGTYIEVASQSVHLNESIYANASEFMPWRFSEMYGEGDEGVSRQLTSANIEYLPFGTGRHTCPGRFFAAAEMKTMLAHLVVTYDVKLENEGVLPPRTSFEMFWVPDEHTRVMFRKRQP